MRKTDLTKMTVGQLKHSPDHIDKLYDDLRNSMSASTVLTLPFDVTKKSARAEALKQRVEQACGYFSEMKYRSASGSYSESGGESQFPFFFEIAIFHDGQNLRSNLAFGQALNCSAIPNTGWTVFGADELFEWQTPGSKYVYTSNTIQDIFRHYGYSYDNKKCKKRHSLIIANLISPKIDYQSYGKSRIDFRPFADVVAKSTVLACMGGGRTSDGKPTKREVLLEVLENREQKWEAMDETSSPIKY